MQAPIDAKQVNEAIRQHWSRRLNSSRNSDSGYWALLLERGKKYVAGFAQSAGISTSLVVVPLRKKAAAIVFAGSSEAAFRQVGSQLERLPIDEIVVVLSHPSAGIKRWRAAFRMPSR